MKVPWRGVGSRGSGSAEIVEDDEGSAIVVVVGCGLGKGVEDLDAG